MMINQVLLRIFDLPEVFKKQNDINDDITKKVFTRGYRRSRSPTDLL